MKFERGFAEATLNTLLATALPFVDQITGGKMSAAGDSIGDRARAGKIACIEAAEFFDALESAAENIEAGTLTLDGAMEIVRQAKDIKTAAALLRDPSVVVQLDGEAVTADDDVTTGTGDADTGGDGDPDIAQP